MNEIESVTFPAIALTPNGVMPYTKCENIKKVVKHEYEMGWFDDLELIGISGDSCTIHSAEIVSEPLLAKLLGRTVEVRILSSSRNPNENVDSIRERVLQHLSQHPDMYLSAGVYDEMVNDVSRATEIKTIVEVFTKIVN